jgi:hypothetical protein
MRDFHELRGTGSPQQLIKSCVLPVFFLSVTSTWLVVFRFHVTAENVTPSYLYSVNLTSRKVTVNERYKVRLVRSQTRVKPAILSPVSHGIGVDSIETGVNQVSAQTTLSTAGITAPLPRKPQVKPQCQLPYCAIRHGTM